jgi:hypothetical protein
MNNQLNKELLDLADKVDILQPFQIKAEIIRIIQNNS